MCLRNVLVNLIQVMGCIMNYYQLSILLWGFFPAKCAILFISLAIILVLLPYTHTHWQASKTWPVMCFYKNIFIFIYILLVCVCVCKYFTMQAVELTFKLLLVSVIFSVLLLLWGVWQVISILGSGTYPPLTCTDSNVKTTLACAQLVKKKKMPRLRLYLACLFFYIFIARNKIYFTVFTEVMPFIKSRSTLAKAQSQTTRACKLLLSRSLHEEYEHFPDAVNLLSPVSSDSGSGWLCELVRCPRPLEHTWAEHVRTLFLPKMSVLLSRGAAYMQLAWQVISLRLWDFSTCALTHLQSPCCWGFI